MGPRCGFAPLLDLATMPKENPKLAPPTPAPRTRSRGPADEDAQRRRSSRTAAVDQRRQPASNGAAPNKVASGIKKRAADEPAHKSRTEDVEDAGRVAPAKCALCATQRIDCVIPRGRRACEHCRRRKVGCSLAGVAPRPKRDRRALHRQHPALDKTIDLLSRIERNTRNAAPTASRAREEEEGSEVDPTIQVP
ncbi:hypothetical protein MSAN_02290500 [Mycena sanguinolenta]|uniref:Zn(2)-C6 fungal-type domain-containing protein n=1 Tax=Mycena sanguinolenta TaxID=230812 RepID=A0A8H7CIG5_9AGAR|nr:hypothetical protein MSAN_02290500 [Mycena sanguinolenta]